MNVKARARHVESLGAHVERVMTITEEAGRISVRPKPGASGNLLLEIGAFDLTLDVEAAKQLRDDLVDIPWVGPCGAR